MDQLENLFTKKGIILQKVAEDLLFIEVNERLPKVGDFAVKYQVGRGTIQAVLKKLEDESCIRLEARGHLGTFLRNKNISNLLRFSGANQITGVMPLPYSKKYEGLATGITSQFEQLGISLNIAFMRGSKPRLNGVKDGRYDFALVSKFSAIEEMKKDRSLKIALEFGSKTYVSEHAVIFSDPDKKNIRDGMKVGIDSFSTDQQILTNAEVQGLNNIEYLEFNYMHLLQHLKAQTVDAMIWNVDEIDHSTYNIQPLTSPLAIQFEKQMNEAVCVIHSENRKMEYILHLLSLTRIVETQKQVVKGDVIPKY
ncbi:GntR family transcriptional regulator YhfZ [Neobacillus pocheonensis]|uniref:GntR family transcriptional regulator YhfZ n=1 Tax=Neobacillus pocheonensis TaxID=363869 RepID=UPI003D2B39D9